MAAAIHDNDSGRGIHAYYDGSSAEWAARTPIRYRDRVITQFRSSENIEYLSELFTKKAPPGALRDFLLNTLEDAVYGYEQVEDFAYSDPLSQRGDLRPAASLWADIRRINLAFYEYRMQFVRDKAALITGHTEDGQWDDDEQYHYRMFEADSLRPPGFEHLNATGPLFGILEDQTAAAIPRRPPGARRGQKGPASRKPPTPGAAREKFVSHSARTSTDAAPLPGVDSEDWGWDSGDPNRTPSQAMSEYWGDSHVETSTLGATEVGGQAHISRYGQGDHWRENDGTRAMRYPEIPYWQHTASPLDATDRDIDETLGTGSRELDSHVRRWDMSRMRNPRGEEYRRYGPRNSSTV